MPRYNPALIEPKWQKYWDEHRTFATPRLPTGPKFYALDMFPYPSGDGLHVGHPEGYTATDIVSRLARMRGRSVLHPMGFDAFGLPAEEHAIRTGTHPREGTEKNIANFRRQLKMLGFSYDWQRELATTDVEYFRWTQWIFLKIYDTWFDPQTQRGRPIGELPIPADVKAEGPAAVARYQDEHRLAYENFAPVNWCPALGTVLANEEVVDGKSEVGGHPVVRMPLRQWMLRITAYAERLEKDLDGLDWSESIKALQRNWIGRSSGAEVDFFLGPAAAFPPWKSARAESGFPRKPGDDVLRIYTTRPDTLFGATYMVIAPEHPLAERLTTAASKQQVKAYCDQAASKSDLDRTELAKTKTGVFTGSYAINPVNGQPVPIWIADYVLISYGTGAIMAVPAHDQRDFEFAQQFKLPITAVVVPDETWAVEHGKRIRPTENVQNIEENLRDAQAVGSIAAAEIASIHEEEYWDATTVPPAIRGAYIYHPEWFDSAFTGAGFAIHSGKYDGALTAEFKKRITDDLENSGLGRGAVNFKLRDWLFSRQRFWGEPFPILHELDAAGKPTGAKRAVPESQLPVDLPHLDDFKPHGRPEPPLDKAPDDWLYPVLDGVRYKRETNTMPQWAGSCWYYLRFIDPKNERAIIDPEVERAWMPVDLYIGGVEHAVLHLLYARFWHKVLFDRGVVSTPEPFQKLVNQGMILGEMEITGYQDSQGRWVTAAEVDSDADNRLVRRGSGEPVASVPVEPVRVAPQDAEKHGEGFVLKAEPSIRLESRAHKMSKSRGNVVNPDAVVREYGADALRLYEMFMGPLEATKPWSMEGVNGVRGFLDRVWRLILDDRAEQVQLNAAVREDEPTAEQQRMIHRTIKVVTADLESMSFNTAIARLMEFVNFFTKEDLRPRAAMEALVLLLSPLAPHIAEELWSALGHGESLAYEPWPKFDEQYLKEDSIEVPVQVNGKLRGRVRVPTGADEAVLEAAARADKPVAAHLDGKSVAKVIVVPGRLVNFVTK